MREALAAEFEEFPQSESRPQVVVIGDIGDRWNYALMNRLFRMLMEGAELVALHKSRYSQTEEGLRLDIGAFVAGLEYVTGREAILVGKPSPTFFRLAVLNLNLRPEEVAMVGDDIEGDVGGAQRSGLKGVLVKTGKYRPDVAARSRVRPDAVLDSIASLLDPALISKRTR
jgi:HAD superfamily hydrolase (TIGR01458 family)